MIRFFERIKCSFERKVESSDCSQMECEFKDSISKFYPFIGTVQISKGSDSCEQIMMKMILVMSFQEAKKLEILFEGQKNLKSPEIFTPIDFLLRRKNFFCKSEFLFKVFYELPYPSLQEEFLKATLKNEGFTHDMILDIAYQVLKALHNIRSKGKFHCQLSMSNILIDKPSHKCKLVLPTEGNENLETCKAFHFERVVSLQSEHDSIYLSPLMFNCLKEKSLRFIFIPEKEELFQLGLILLECVLNKKLNVISSSKDCFDQQLLNNLIFEMNLKLEKRNRLLSSLISELLEIKEDARCDLEFLFSNLPDHEKIKQAYLSNSFLSTASDMTNIDIRRNKIYKSEFLENEVEHYSFIHSEHEKESLNNQGNNDEFCEDRKESETSIIHGIEHQADNDFHYSESEAIKSKVSQSYICINDNASKEHSRSRSRTKSLIVVGEDNTVNNDDHNSSFKTHKPPHDNQSEMKSIKEENHPTIDFQKNISLTSNMEVVPQSSSINFASYKEKQIEDKMAKNQIENSSSLRRFSLQELPNKLTIRDKIKERFFKFKEKNKEDKSLNKIQEKLREGKFKYLWTIPSEIKSHTEISNSSSSNELKIIKKETPNDNSISQKCSVKDQSSCVFDAISKEDNSMISNDKRALCSSVIKEGLSNSQVQKTVPWNHKTPVKNFEDELNIEVSKNDSESEDIFPTVTVQFDSDEDGSVRKSLITVDSKEITKVNFNSFKIQKYPKFKNSKQQ